MLARQGHGDESAFLTEIKPDLSQGSTLQRYLVTVSIQFFQLNWGRWLRVCRMCVYACVCADGRVDVKTVGRGDEDDDDEVDAAHAPFPLHEAPGRRRAKSCNVCVRVLLVSSTALERRANR